MKAAWRIALSFLALVAATSNLHAADAAFQQFLQSLLPQAEKFGITRATFEAATRDLEPDLSLPDLVIPGQTPKPDRQPEFVQTPADYLKKRRSRVWQVRAARSPPNTATLHASNAISACRRRSCSPSGDAKADFRAATAAAMPSVCSRHRPISASARTSFAKSSSMR